MDFGYPPLSETARSARAGIASVALTVGLQPDRRGTHMSRLVQIAGQYLSEFDPRELPIVLKALRATLDSPSAALSIQLPVAISVDAPTTGLRSHNVIDVTFEGTADAGGARVSTVVQATTTSLCPCSKEVSDYGAHNQRSIVNVTRPRGRRRPVPSDHRLHSTN